MFVLAIVGLITLFLFIWIFRRSGFNKGSVRGRRVLITGASSGIGAELAFQYAKLGASVFITARREELLIQNVEKCESLGIESAKHGYCVCDMSKYKTESKQVIEEAVKFLGGLDTMIINHANIGYMKMWYGTQDNLDLFDNSMDVNLNSYVHLASHALPHLMKSEQGRLGVMGSVAGKMCWAGAATYSACKFALDGFFSSLSIELQQAKDKFTVTMLMPGFIATQMVTERLQEGVTDLQKHGNMLERMANTKFEDVEKVAHEILRATETGQKEMYYPFLYRSAYFTMPTFLIPIFRCFVPPLLPPMVWKPELFTQQKEALGLLAEE